MFLHCYRPGDNGDRQASISTSYLYNCCVKHSAFNVYLYIITVNTSWSPSPYFKVQLILYVNAFYIKSDVYHVFTKYLSYFIHNALWILLSENWYTVFTTVKAFHNQLDNELQQCQHNKVVPGCNCIYRQNL